VFQVKPAEDVIGENEQPNNQKADNYNIYSLHSILRENNNFIDEQVFELLSAAPEESQPMDNNSSAR